MNKQKSAHYQHLLGQGREISLLIDTPMSLPALYIYNRTGPTMPGGSTFTPQIDNDAEWEKAMKEYLWVRCRMIGSSGKQPMPAFGGFISATGKTPDKKSTIVYYPPINGPITAYNTVAELLKRSAEATAEVGQKYTIVTFDLGVCMKALPLIWTFSEQYKDHIVVIGQFHTSMNYLNMLGHKNIYFQEEVLRMQLSVPQILTYSSFSFIMHHHSRLPFIWIQAHGSTVSSLMSQHYPSLYVVIMQQR